MVIPAILLQPMSGGDVGRVAEIHAAELQGDFLPSLGLEFLQKSYYPEMLRNPHACVLVARDPNTSRVAGFVNIATAPEFLSWYAGHNLATLSARMLGVMLREPRRVMEAFVIARHRSKVPEGAGEIAFIAVDRERQGQGIGGMMVDAANRHLARLRFRRCYTKTLASNERIVHFYRKRYAAEPFATASILGKRYVLLAWDVPPTNA